MVTCEASFDSLCHVSHKLLLPLAGTASSQADGVESLGLVLHLPAEDKQPLIRVGQEGDVTIGARASG